MGQLSVCIKALSLGKNILFRPEDIETLITQFTGVFSSTMSEEVTYATLSFQDSVGAGNNQNRNNLRKKGKDSGKVQLDLAGWTGVQGFEVPALIPTLKRRKLRNRDKVVEYIS